MADKLKVPFFKPDGTSTEEIGTVMTIKEANEPWAEYVLEDDTKIRLKQIPVSIVKLDTEKNPNGDPVYIIQCQQVMTVIPKISEK